MSTQASTGRCDCGARYEVLPTDSVYEFEWRCGCCPRAGRISWAHALPPPTYRLPMLDLFSAPAEVIPSHVKLTRGGAVIP